MIPFRRRLSALTYVAANELTRAVVYTFSRWTVEGRDHIPTDGPLILVANHLHLLDPPLVGASATRRVHPMAKRELFETPLVGWYFWAYGAFPVRRFSGDTGALRVARNYLRNNEVVLMFPEGTRSKTGAMRAALPGAGMVALLSKAPIVPVAITGSNVDVPGVFFRWLRRDRPRITVTFGEPIAVSTLLERGTGTATDDSSTDGASNDATRKDGDAADRGSESRSAEIVTDGMMRAIAALLPAEMRGEYGSETDGTVVVARQSRRPDTETPSDAAD